MGRAFAAGLPGVHFQPLTALTSHTKAARVAPVVVGSTCPKGLGRHEGCQSRCAPRRARVCSSWSEPSRETYDFVRTVATG
jgi:hypothetical protein